MLEKILTLEQMEQYRQDGIAINLPSFDFIIRVRHREHTNFYTTIYTTPYKDTVDHYEMVDNKVEAYIISHYLKQGRVVP